MRIPYNRIKVKETLPFDLQRKVVAHATSASWKEVPHVASLYEPDVSALLEQFKLVKERFPEKKKDLTVTVLTLKLIAEGLKSSPRLNAHLSYSSRFKSGFLSIHSSINVTLPWLLSDGRMITPVISGIENKSMTEISNYIEEIRRKIGRTDIDELLYEAAVKDTIHSILHCDFSTLRGVLSSRFGRNRIVRMNRAKRKEYYSVPESERLTPDDLACGTVTISNTGSLYPYASSTITFLDVLPPQVFAAGISSMRKIPMCISDGSGESIQARTTLPMALVFDHRAFDFDALIPFMKRIDQICSHPEEIAGWI